MPDSNARILAYTSLADPIEMQREAVPILIELLGGRSDEELRRGLSPGKWSSRLLRTSPTTNACQVRKKAWKNIGCCF
jgi:hypothetical protein